MTWTWQRLEYNDTNEAVNWDITAQGRARVMSKESSSSLIKRARYWLLETVDLKDHPWILPVNELDRQMATKTAMTS